MVTKNQHQQPDPLYTIFEQHLLNFQDSQSDRKTFIVEVINEYLNFLKKKSITIPAPLAAAVYEELGAQVNTMLAKKIYGCVNVNEFVENQPITAKRRARVRYKKLVQKA